MLSYDVYVLSALRDSQYINHFINIYASRSVVEDREDEELMVLPSDITDENSISFEQYDWVPAININHVINIAIGKPTRAFRFYLPSIMNSISVIIMIFTTDHKVIYGLSVEIEDKEKSLLLAEQYLKELYATYHGMVGGIFYEELAPLDTLEFMELLINNSLKAI